MYSRKSCGCAWIIYCTTLEFESCVLKQFQVSRIFVQSIKSRIHFQPNRFSIIVLEALLERFQCARTVVQRQQGGGTIGGTGDTRRAEFIELGEAFGSGETV
jgi:hypothetical protein